MFVSEKNPYIKDLNALRILINFLCIYLGEKGGALMQVYVWREKEGDLTQSYDKTPYTNRKFEIWEHIVSLYYRTA